MQQAPNNNFDPHPYLLLQEKIAEQIIVEDELPDSIQYVAGVDVAYNEKQQRMAGAVAVLDATTLELVDQAYHLMEITFPYIPGLFSFREIPPLLEAIKKLQKWPNLIVCDGHGIAHPKGVGMASHLGVELGIPTIGCAKSRLVGAYDEVGTKKGAFSSLIFDNKEVGRVLRTRDDVKPVFVSVGHRVSIETACQWVLRLCPKYRLPETTRKADTIVNAVIKGKTEINFPD